MEKILYKWLPIVFGCHCRPDRSFHWNGRPFQICARCTGELLGILVLCATYWLWHPKWQLCMILCVPMLADGFLQAITSYESNNIKRLLTGFLFGYGFFCLFFLSNGWAYQFGRELAGSRL